MKSIEFSKKVSILCLKLFLICCDIAAIRYFTTNAIISNEIALKQMQNDNTAFIQAEFYTAYKNWAELLLGILIIWIFIPYIIKGIFYIKKRMKNENK